MTDWHPDPSDGLRGDRLISDSLLATDPPDDDPTQSGIYVVRCCMPGDSLHAHAREWHKHRDTHPPEVTTLPAADRLLYVGSASNVARRVAEHVAGNVRQSTFTLVYPPFDVPLVDWNRPRHEERMAAVELSQSHPDWAVWCDGEVVG